MFYFQSGRKVFSHLCFSDEHVQKSWSLTCLYSQGGLPQFSYASDDCTYYFTWFSNLACDIANDNEDVTEDCTATNPATGHIFDLSSLKDDKGYGVKGKDRHMYTINVCAPVKDTVCTEYEGVGKEISEICLFVCLFVCLVFFYYFFLKRGMSLDLASHSGGFIRHI